MTTSYILTAGTASCVRGTIQARHSSTRPEVHAGEDRLFMIAVAALTANQGTRLATELF